MLTQNEAARELADYLRELQRRDPVAFAASRAKHNRWHAAHATRLALSEWLEERRATS